MPFYASHSFFVLALLPDIPTYIIIYVFHTLSCYSRLSSENSSSFTLLQNPMYIINTYYITSSYSRCILFPQQIVSSFRAGITFIYFFNIIPSTQYQQYLIPNKCLFLILKDNQPPFDLQMNPVFQSQAVLYNIRAGTYTRENNSIDVQRKDHNISNKKF